MQLSKLSAEFYNSETVSWDFSLLYVFMSVLFLLQLFIIALIFFIIYSRSFFFLLLNSIAFLVLLVSFSWIHDVDIFSSFLLIIDLGLFLVFFIMALSVLVLFQPIIKSFYNCFFLLPIFFFYFIQSNYCLTWDNTTFNISFYDWYNLFHLFFISELQLISECYFSLCSLEFFIINIYLYLAVLSIYYLISLSALKSSLFSVRSKQLFTLWKKQSSFFKWQNPNSQQNSPQVLRSWAN